MANTYKKLYQGQLAAAAATLYTVPGSTTAIIKTIVVVNDNASNRTFSLYHDGTANTNLITPLTWPILGNEIVEWNGTMVMEAADTLSGVASVASDITVTVYGVEIV